MNTMQHAAESATGCRENPHGLGKLFAHGGEELSVTKAKKLFRAGEVIEIPNAGAGSYKKVLALLGFKLVEVVEWTSSAGDWTLAVKTGDGWKPVYQNNRYPGFGFSYTLGILMPCAFGTFEELCNHMEQ